jgi:hypothetical protein
MTPKQARANQIAQIVQCIADHYAIPDIKIVDRVDYKSVKVASARYIFEWHLYDCGLSFDAIATLQGRDVDTIRTHYAKGGRIVLDGMRDFVDALPRVTTTLEMSDEKSDGTAGDGTKNL